MHKKLWNKDYILLLQGNAVSTLGDLMYSVAIGYWVYAQTGSSALMGIMSSISMFVTMFFSPFCGSIVDKCNRKWVIVGIDTVQGILMLMVGVLAYRNALNVPAVLVVALIAAVNDGKITFLAACGKEAVAKGVKAGDIIKTIAPICGGKGGGKPDSAMGGGSDLAKLDEALASVNEFVASKLG